MIEIISFPFGQPKIYYKGMNITVVGAGYVGLSLAVLLAQENLVTLLDINPEKIDLIGRRLSPIKDSEIESFLQHKNLSLQATCDKSMAYQKCDYVIIATPTDYDDLTNRFNTEAVESVIEEALRLNPRSYIIIKSTVPVGFTQSMRDKHRTQNICFSPEFLREGQALHDNIQPSRIVIGAKDEQAVQFVELLIRAAKLAGGAGDTPILHTSSDAAETIKLFANTYLAMRVAFFNELDTYSLLKGIEATDVIKGTCLDPRIGDHYNNPSFGYGGYCLPKDTKQLLANCLDIPQTLIAAIVQANHTRQLFIADHIIEKKKTPIGIYRLTMKSDSDNIRSSSVQEVIKHLKSKNVPMLIYEPSLSLDEYEGVPLVKDLQEFMNKSQLIIANRYSAEISGFSGEIFSRDLFARD